MQRNVARTRVGSWFIALMVWLTGCEGTQRHFGSGSGPDASVAPLELGGSQDAAADAGDRARQGVMLTARQLADPCENDNQCASQQCVDGVCCDGPCSEVCATCAAPGAEGTCTATAPDSACEPLECVEGAVVPCGPESDIGECQRGTSTCVEGAFTPCQDAIIARPRNCGSALDNDCDGVADNTIDATCTCRIGSPRVCGEHPGRDGNGPCRPGEQTCEGIDENASSRFGSCTESVGPGLRDSCTVFGDDADCDGSANGGCQCVAGRGNAPCSGDANNSRCNALGACSPCQANEDCSLVAAGRTLCDAGRCVISRCGDRVVSGVEACDDGNTTNGDGCSNTCSVERANGAECTSGAQCQSGRCLDYFEDVDGDGVAALAEAMRPQRFCAVTGFAIAGHTALRPSGLQVDTDCCDSDELVNFRFTSIENDPTACGHFDWNCSGIVETLYANARLQPCNLISVPDICNTTRLAPGGPELCGQSIQLTDCRFVTGTGCVTSTVTGGSDILLCQ